MIRFGHRERNDPDCCRENVARRSPTSKEATRLLRFAYNDKKTRERILKNTYTPCLSITCKKGSNFKASLFIIFKQ